MDTTAIVLAGGRGSRMNYEEKAWMLHRGKPLITHVLESITPQVDMIVVSRNNTSEPRYDELPFKCIEDNDLVGSSDGHEGPLSGISACLNHITTPLTLVVPCDTPRLPSDLVQLLRNGLGEESMVVAHDGINEQPLIFLAKTIVLKSIDNYLASGRRSVKGWLDGIKHNRAYFRAGSEDFENINSIDQLV